MDMEEPITQVAKVGSKTLAHPYTAVRSVLVKMQINPLQVTISLFPFLCGQDDSSSFETFQWN